LRNFRKRVAISIALLSLQAAAALAAEAPDQPLGVLDQPRPEYQAHGIALFDDWILYPSLAERVNYDNNVFRSLLIGGAPSDWFLESTPVLRVQHKTDTTALGFSGSLDNLAYARFHQLDLTDWTIAADGSVTFAQDDFSASAAASYGEYHEGFESAEVTRVLQQRSYTRYFRGHVDAVANYNPDNWRLSAGASYDSFDWQPTELVRQRDGGITSFSNKIRDESLANPFLRIGYQLTPDYQVFVRAVYDSRSFLSLPPPHLDRSSSGYRLDGGVALKIGKSVKGEVYGGYLRQDFAEPLLPDFSAIDYGAALDWYVAPTFTLHFNAARALSDVVLPGVSVTDDQSVRIGFDSELRHDLILQGFGAYTDSHYVGLNRTDHYPSAGVTLRYLINQYASAELSYVYTSRGSTLESTNFRDQILSAGLLLHI
jgi:hypothetical protein